MTAHELMNKFAREFGFKPWPATYAVDAETYGYVCQAVFDHALKDQFPAIGTHFQLKITVGPNNGIVFKNVEIILND